MVDLVTHLHHREFHNRVNRLVTRGDTTDTRGRTPNLVPTGTLIGLTEFIMKIILYTEKQRVFVQSERPDVQGSITSGEIA